MANLASLCSVCLLLVVYVASRNISTIPSAEQGIKEVERLIPGSEQKIRDTIAGRSNGDKDIRDILEGLNKISPRPGWKLPDGPIDPAKAIELILKAHCQLLRQLGVINLPEYCFTLPAAAYPQGGFDKSPLVSDPNSRDTGIDTVYY